MGDSLEKVPLRLQFSLNMGLWSGVRIMAELIISESCPDHPSFAVPGSSLRYARGAGEGDRGGAFVGGTFGGGDGRWCVGGGEDGRWCVCG